MASAGKKPLVMVQKPMIQVVLALLPLTIASIYFFGWKTLAVLAIVNVAGFLSEYVFARTYKKQVTSAVFVTNFLFALSLPPTIPLWIPVIGIVFGVVFAKMAFGGFGRNVFNPAISGRAFIFVSFGAQMSASQAWVNPVGGIPGGFAKWQADAVTQATPLVQMAHGTHVPLLNLFLGNTAGSFGETSAVLILLGGLFLMIRKTSSWRIVVSGITAYLVFELILWLAGVSGAIDPLRGLLGGSLLYVMMFMATDPVSASQTTETGRVIYGAFIGLLACAIRVFAVWPEGMTFAVLLANMFGPLLNHLIREARNRRKAGAQA